MQDHRRRAMEFPIPDGYLALDALGYGRSGRLEAYAERVGVRIPLESLAALRSVLREAGVEGTTVAGAEPAPFAHFLCVLSGRPVTIAVRDSMWQDLEPHFGLMRAENQPTQNGTFYTFLSFSSYMPVLKISRTTVDLAALDVRDEILVEAPWPPKDRTPPARIGSPAVGGD